MTGRQSMRMILDNFKTDKIAKELFNVTHLHDLQYPGDSKLDEFMEDWFRIEDDQEDPSTDRQKERILFAKIQYSKALKPYLDKYNMLDDDDENHSYQFLLDSIERYQQKTKKAKNLNGLTNALLRKDQPPPSATLLHLKSQESKNILNSRCHS